MKNNVPMTLTIQEAADLTNLPYDYVRKLAKSGTIAAVKSGRKTYIVTESLLHYVKNGGISRNRTALFLAAF